MKRLRGDERGTTAIEYALIVSLIFLAIIGGVTAFGGKTMLTYDYIGTEIGKAM